jgi:hypothetical protein
MSSPAKAGDPAISNGSYGKISQAIKAGDDGIIRLRG